MFSLSIFIIYYLLLLIFFNTGSREGFVSSVEEEMWCKFEYFNFRKNLFGAWWDLTPTNGIERFDLDRQDKESSGNNYKFSCYDQLWWEVRKIYIDAIVI